MRSISRRHFLRSTALTTGLVAAGLRARPARGQAGKPYAGARIKMSQVTHAYGDGLVARLPEFEQQDRKSTRLNSSH